MATYTFAPVPTYGSVGGLLTLGARAGTATVKTLAGTAATVVQGGATKVGYLDVSPDGTVAAFTTTDLPSVRVNFGLGELAVHSFEAISAGASSAADATAARDTTLGYRNQAYTARTQAQTAAESVALNATKFGTNGAAIQSALDAVFALGGGTVLIPARAGGASWNLTTSLIVKAGVRIEAHADAIIASTGASPLILNGNAAANGYAGQSDITISGGTWDCGGATVAAGNVRTGFAFAHATGITVRDLTIKNVGSGHAVEFNAVDGAVVDNVRFDGFYNTNSRDDTEAVQVDVARTGNFPWFGNNDGTISKNVTITNCWVGNTGGGSLWWRGFGAHNTVVDDPYTGMRVLGNYIRTRSTGVRAYNWSGFVISGNVLEGGGIWVQSTETSRTADTVNKVGTQTSASADVGDGTILANTIRPGGLTMQYHGIWLSGSASGKIVRVALTGNVIAGTNNTQHGIRAVFADAFNIAGNLVSGTAAQGISLDDSALGLVSANRILGAANSAAIHLTGASAYSTIIGNVITDSAQAGILASGTSHQLSIKANTLVGSSALTNSGYNAIHLSGVDDCQVLLNTVRKNTAASNHAAAALFINSTCDRTWHTLNDFRTASNNAAVNDAGTASVTTAGTLT